MRENVQRLRCENFNKNFEKNFLFSLESKSDGKIRIHSIYPPYNRQRLEWNGTLENDIFLMNLHVVFSIVLKEPQNTVFSTRDSQAKMTRNSWTRGDTCSWKGQLERTRSWKVFSWKVCSWKVSLKLERAKRSWKEPSEVEKNPAKLERTQQSWKEPTEVGKFLLKLENFAKN